MTENVAIDLSDRAPLQRFWLVAGAWLALAMAQALVLQFQLGLSAASASFSAVIHYSTMAPLVWMSCRLNARRRLWNGPLLQALGAYILIGIVGMTVWSAAFVGVMRVAIGPAFWRIVFADSWMFQLLSASFTYAAAFGLGLAVQAIDREHEGREREARLEAVARAAEIEGIKGQLRPHFLLNSLNSLLALVDHDPAEARRMIVLLSSLLHTVFDGLDEAFVPLGRELELTRAYLEIERIRFGDRLQFSVQADDAAAAALVPPFLLQPLVENALRHGIEPSADRGVVTVSARLDAAGRLAIEVSNSVNGTHRRAGTGRGLELTRQRLRALYGERGAVLNTGRQGAGFTAAIDLPVADAG
jgi:two-component system LytT family sensor kinase